MTLKSKQGHKFSNGLGTMTFKRSPPTQGEVLPMFQCPGCDKRFTRADSCKRHFWGVHDEPGTTSTGGVPATVDDTPTVAFAVEVRVGENSEDDDPVDATPTVDNTATVEVEDIITVTSDDSDENDEDDPDSDYEDASSHPTSQQKRTHEEAKLASEGEDDLERLQLTFNKPLGILICTRTDCGRSVVEKRWHNHLRKDHFQTVPASAKKLIAQLFAENPEKKRIEEMVPYLKVHEGFACNLCTQCGNRKSIATHFCSQHKGVKVTCRPAYYQQLRKDKKAYEVFRFFLSCYFFP